MEYKIIDCDQHVIEAPKMWEEVLPAKFQDRAPKLTKDEDGGDAWLLGDCVEPQYSVTVDAAASTGVFCGKAILRLEGREV